jgi:hypothetical protein
MNLRLSQKLCTKIKAGSLKPNAVGRESLCRPVVSFHFAALRSCAFKLMYGSVWVKMWVKT